MNELKIFNEILENFKKKFYNFSIKNFSIKNLYNLKVKIDNTFFILEKICLIKQLKERNYLIQFKNENFLKKFLNNNFFEIYGFQVINKKKIIELQIPNLSLEFRKKFINILKNEYLFCKELIEFNRKKFITNFKKNLKSEDEYYRFEKILNKEFNLVKLNLKNFYESLQLKILDE